MVSFPLWFVVVYGVISIPALLFVAIAVYAIVRSANVVDAVESDRLRHE